MIGDDRSEYSIKRSKGAAYANFHQEWMARKIDCTAFLTYFIENYSKSVEETKNATAEFWKQFK